ncbi:hypothetical protein RIF29_37135 [Crotalaria pallida]|uniref:Pectate lyase n=1 Tax=Crotalaria pallida TaxID=3830 RepID=A0AAN9EC05_CROPI
MASQGTKSIFGRFVLAIVIAIIFTPNFTSAKKFKVDGLKMNVIDKCWRSNPEWRKHHSQLATCSIGYAGKMTNNIGTGLIHYKVTDASDDPINPKPGTLRYGASVIQGKIWITFQRGMLIKLVRPLLISNFTTIDGRGTDVHIAHNACLMIFKSTNIIIHGLRIHHCKPQAPGMVMGPNGKVTWRKGNHENRDKWEFHSVRDVFENGASFMATKDKHVTKPNYTKEQVFKVADAKCVRSLTRASGALRCSKTSIC